MRHIQYLAEVTNQNGTMGARTKVVVKFVTRYGEEVREFLAREG